MTIIINTPDAIRDHFSSKEHSCRVMAWRKHENGITAHFICCKDHVENYLLIMALAWDSIDESWKKSSNFDFLSVVKLLCKVLDRRIKKHAWFSFLDTFDACDFDQPYWDADELAIGVRDEFGMYTFSEVVGHFLS